MLGFVADDIVLKQASCSALEDDIDGFESSVKTMNYANYVPI